MVSSTTKRSPFHSSRSTDTCNDSLHREGERGVVECLEMNVGANAGRITGFLGVNNAVFDLNQLNINPLPETRFLYSGLPLHQIALDFDGLQGVFHGFSLKAHLVGLHFDLHQSGQSHGNTEAAKQSQDKIDPNSGLIVSIFAGGRDDPYIGLCVVAGFFCEFGAAWLLWLNIRSRLGWLIVAGCLLCFLRLGVSLYREDDQRKQEYLQHSQHDGKNVSQKLMECGLLI